MPSLLIDHAGVVLHLAENVGLRVYLLRVLTFLLAFGGFGVTVYLGLRVIDVVRANHDSPPGSDDTEL